MSLIKRIMVKSKQNNQQMPNEHLHELFLDELKDILGAERQLLKGLKKMSKATENSQLKKAFDKHHNQTEGQIERLKEVFGSLGITARGKTCKAMEGLLKEADEIIENFEGDPALDAALISAAQKVEHYEIASYGCLTTFAKLMEHTEAEQLLRQTLDEEKQTDTLLTEIAISAVNESV